MELDLHLLAPESTTEEVAERCRAAAGAGLRAVVVRPCDVEGAVAAARGLIVASVAGWPDGTSTTPTKLYEMRDLLRRGAREIEFVLNAVWLRARQFASVETELDQAVRACRENGATLTAVLHPLIWSEDLPIIAAKICRRVEAHAISVPAERVEAARPLLRDKLLLKAAPVEAARPEFEACRSIGSEAALAIAEQLRRSREQDSGMIS